MNRRLLALLLAFVILITAAVIGSWVIAHRAVEKLTVHKQESTVDLGAIVTEVRQLNRLETASMHVIHISTITQTYTNVPDTLAGDQLTFLAAGDVIAGVDLSRITDRDVWRQRDGTIVLRLPPSQVLVSRIDNGQSRVLSRKTGLLRRGDVNLESRVRQSAEEGIRAEAIKKGILPMASQNAETKLAAFLHTLGFQKVKFVAAGTLRPLL